MIYSLSHLLDKLIGTSAHVWLIGHASISAHLAWLSLTSWHAGVTSDDIRSVLFVAAVVGEEETLCINDCLYDFSCLFTLFAECLDDDVHHFGDHRWESLEDLVYDTAGQSLKKRIGLLNELQSWVSKLVNLRSDQIYEDIN